VTRASGGRVARVLLIHWNEDEARERARRLARAGHDVTPFWQASGRAPLERLREKPPDAFVIDLARRPSQGRDMATWLRAQAPTRGVPLVLVGATREMAAQLRGLLPDAPRTTWRSLPKALQRALASPPERPANPGVLAGYSGTPLPRKLGIKAGTAVRLIGAPDDFAATLGELPEGASLVTRGQAPVVVAFLRSRRELAARFPRATAAAEDGGRVWLAWPKKASGVATDVTETHVRAHGLENGWVDFKICAIDATWSGLAFARRKVGGR